MSFIVYIVANEKANILRLGFTDKVDEVYAHVGLADIATRLVYYERHRNMYGALKSMLDLSTELYLLKTGFIWKSNPEWKDLRPRLETRVRRK